MNTADLTRRLDNLIRLGTIEQVDVEAHPAPRVRVMSGRLLTDWLPYFMVSAGADHDAGAPSVGEGCVILSPGGDPAQGFVLTGLPTTLWPCPDFSDTQRARHFRDGAVIRYDSETHHLEVMLPADATCLVRSLGGLTIEGDVNVVGKLTASVDVIAAGVSLVEHPTSGVQAGSGQSGPPVATS
ncbi:phage baseplate assembly protein V [Perlucidibaca piscinae]|uniref:phage baseplate assembly protein V n=1 Tax=Perlucidibaca piscinae TaxID=392589 RepID=UPI0003B4A561|nr:phage baseplate assembly protein V [Perlucidibaca piscinae]